MGSGYGLKLGQHYYTHAKAYMDLKDRVDLVGFVDPDQERGEWAKAHWGDVALYPDLQMALEDAEPTVVSVCTPPESQVGVLDELRGQRVLGVWCEKPFMPKVADFDYTIQVDYCRRFDLLHVSLRNILSEATHRRLVVMAKKDIHTVSHMTDLARFWGVDHFDYVDTPEEPGAYFLRYKLGGDWKEMAFPAGGISGDYFMMKALENLLWSVDAGLSANSSPGSAILSEEWANRILKG